MVDLPEQFSPERLVECMREHSGKPVDALPDGIVDALRLAHALSQQREEDRPIRVALALTRRGQSLPAERVLLEPVTRFEDIRRLCPAVARERMCMRFGPVNGEWGVLSIAGRPDMGGPLLAHAFWGQIALAEAIDPGQVSLEVGDDAVRYENGRYVAADPFPHIRMIVPPFVVSAIYTYASTLSRFEHCLYLGGSVVRVDEAAYARHRNAFEDEMRDAASLVASDAIHFLAEYTNRLRHGGTILIVNDPGELIWRDRIVAPRHVFGPRYDASGTQKTNWNAGMLDTLAWEVHRRLASKNVAIVPLDARFAGRDGLEAWRRDIADIRFNHALENWRQEAQMCAQLTQIDGAVLFNAMLSPCALGVEFLGVSDDAAGALPEQFRPAAGGRGMRHKSAARLVDRLPGSLALVASQDGGVTAFAHGVAGEKTGTRIL